MVNLAAINNKVDAISTPNNNNKKALKSRMRSFHMRLRCATCKSPLNEIVQYVGTFVYNCMYVMEAEQFWKIKNWWV